MNIIGKIAMFNRKFLTLSRTFRPITTDKSALGIELLSGVIAADVGHNKILVREVLDSFFNTVKLQVLNSKTEIRIQGFGTENIL